MDISISNRLKLYLNKTFEASNSQAGKWLQYSLIEVNQGELTAKLTIREEMTNPNGQLHGGMYALIFDEICGLSFYSMGYTTFYTTINLHVDFLKSANLNEEITIQAKVLRAGKRSAFVIGDIFNAKQEHLAHATTNLINTHKEIFNLGGTES
jgi:uncharacterized protein (TIGR00369 family)